MALRVIIVDDEAPARRKIKRLVDELSDWSVVGEASSVAAATADIERHQPDVVLLDIQLGDGTGFDVVDRLPHEMRPRIVFVTAYDQHAVRAFEVHAQDYLLKPVERERFADCVHRVEAGSSSAELNDRLQRVLSHLRTRRYLDRLYVERADRGHFLSVKRIVRIVADRNYVVVHAGEQSYRLREPLGSLANQLDPHSFARVNRSTIVNIDAIVEVQTWFRGDRILVLSDRTKVRLARAYLTRSPGLSQLG